MTQQCIRERTAEYLKKKKKHKCNHGLKQDDEKGLNHAKILQDYLTNIPLRFWRTDGRFLK